MWAHVLEHRKGPAHHFCLVAQFCNYLTWLRPGKVKKEMQT